eukprot:5231300-Heterocapsa_arctica.AAC.1
MGIQPQPPPLAPVKEVGMSSQQGEMRGLEAAMISRNDSVREVESAFQMRIRDLYSQECGFRELFLTNLEHAMIKELVDISRAVKEAADRNYVSGGRILDYIPRDRRLSNHIYAFT